MSMFEGGVASKPEPGFDLPEFPVVLRGYERQQVHAFVQELASRVGVERRRADQAERTATQLRQELESGRSPAPLSFEHLGAEAAKVLEQAGASAKLLIEEARGRGETIVEAAQTQAAELIELAEQRAAELEAEARRTLTDAAGERDRILADIGEEAERVRVRAEDDARTAMEGAIASTERIRQKAMAEQLAMQSETGRLRESRDRTLEYLTRIHADLGVLLADVRVTEPEAAAAGRDDEEEHEDDGLYLRGEYEDDLEGLETGRPQPVESPAG